MLFVQEESRRGQRDRKDLAERLTWPDMGIVLIRRNRGSRWEGVDGQGSTYFMKKLEHGKNNVHTGHHVGFE